MDDQLFKDKLSSDIVALLVTCKIPTAEKQVWLQVIPHMTEEEKTKLKENLEKQIEHELKVEEKAVDEVVKAMDSMMTA